MPLSGRLLGALNNQSLLRKETRVIKKTFVSSSHGSMLTSLWTQQMSLYLSISLSFVKLVRHSVTITMRTLYCNIH